MLVFLVVVDRPVCSLTKRALKQFFLPKGRSKNFWEGLLWHPLNVLDRRLFQMFPPQITGFRARMLVFLVVVNRPVCSLTKRARKQVFLAKS